MVGVVVCVMVEHKDRFSRTVKFSIILIFGVLSLATILKFLIKGCTISSVKGSSLCFFALELIVLVQVSLVLFKLVGVLTWTWGVVLLPCWPMVYILFGIIMVIFSHFIFNLFSLICSPTKKKGKISFLFFSS